MNKRKKWVRFSVTAASVAMVGIISLAAVQPSSASEMMGKIMNTISLGHISVSQVEPAPEQLAGAIPEEMKHQIMAQAKDQPVKPDALVVKDPGQLNQYTSFHVLLPAYQPSGYTFDRAEFYKDEQGTVSGSKYIDIYYTNPETGKFIYMQQRHADEETAFSQSTTHQVNRVQVNHTDAVMIGEHSIDWEAGGVLYGITAKGLSKDEILKIAESIPTS
ncbi:DUF4367 domain-containing protein [Paenibacillus oceani]|uniref:DUF4367 domain-containing protein n=1 Tax=Paenibacillus oceani TaxID=2772510 RepID=A0A927CAT0_9BACL|nr:DUF4367 domain-containing protein [Paenibacillus oceani]MBD2862851.1 DUF4367 domain-containing protein [Paenibacillus oceani]